MTTPDAYESLRQLAIEAALVGGETLLAWREKFTAREKGPADLVTDADVASQEAVRQHLLSKRPEDCFLGEESPIGSVPDAEPGQVCWVVDPLDGTTNYVHGFPAFATSIAAVVDGQPIAGAIYDPNREEVFSAHRGGGGWLGATRLQPTTAATIEESLVAISLPPQVTADSPDVKAFISVLERCRAVRRTGSAALNLAYVAAGRLDANWACIIYPWDVAAGVLIAQEAGAAVSNSTGGPFDVWKADYLVASTEPLRQQLLQLMTGQPIR